MIFYLTFNDGPSGIYSSQVIDVVKYLRTELNANIKLVSFISIRDFLYNRSAIKKEISDAIVIPMFPGVRNWRWNLYSLKLICNYNKVKLVIGRSVLATNLALDVKKSNSKLKVVYDGRGAIEAEWKEYKVITDHKMLSEIHTLEKDAINQADFRIAVSEQLVKHWVEKFEYSGSSHVVIPCTLNKAFEKFKLEPPEIAKKRNLIGFKETDLIFIYSGSVAGWQSFDLVYNFIRPVLENNLNAKLFFLADRSEKIKKMETEFPGRIISKKVTPKEVPEYLSIGDYGLLLRENTITNKVASPVKFAEYLACGLPVVISDQTGDYSDFTAQHKCGCLPGNFSCIAENLSPKLAIQKTALEIFTKKNYYHQYKKVIETAFSQS